MPMTFDDKKRPNVSGDPIGNEMDQVATHQRLLIAAAMRTEGSMLELGVGWYSTPLLHEIAMAQNRSLRTIDNNQHWLNPFNRFKNNLHSLELVGWWGEAVYEERYGLCFVDQGQPIEREYAVRRLIDQVDVFVFHDTEEGFAYGYDRTLPMFAYQFTDTCQSAFTTVASNVIDVTKWGLVQLPKTGLAEEVT